MSMITENAITLLKSWWYGDEDEQRETLAFLKRVLDEDRLSYRKLFDGGYNERD